MTHPSSSQILHSLEKYKQIHIFITGVPLAPKAVDSRGDELSLLGYVEVLSHSPSFVDTLACHSPNSASFVAETLV